MVDRGVLEELVVMAEQEPQAAVVVLEILVQEVCHSLKIYIQKIYNNSKSGIPQPAHTINIILYGDLYQAAKIEKL